MSHEGEIRNFPEGRTPRKRGRVHEKRGLGKNKVCVLTAIDRTNKTEFLKPVSLANLSKKDLEDHFLDCVYWDKSVLVTDGSKAFKGFSNGHEITHYIANARSSGTYHINTINNLHKQLEQFIDQFNGVATKYLDNYLAWFQFRNASSQEIKDILFEQDWVTKEELRTRQMTLK